MKIAVVGTGYVGLVQGVCMAELGNDVVCIDVDKAKVETLRKSKSPIYEPGIEELIKKNLEAGRVRFETDLSTVLNDCEVVFIAVGTPPDEDGKADLQYVLQVAEQIGKNLKKNGIVVVNKSTVPIGTGQLVRQKISEHFSGDFDVVSNPEFLREGTALEDFMKPDRVVLGAANGRQAAEKIANLYDVLGCPILITDLETAEMIKYASNSFLATQISYINSLSHLCEKVGANVDEVAAGMKLDKRIGERAFLSAGLGYGGSCFPKDVQALVQIAKENEVPFKILEEVENVNQDQRKIFTDRVKDIVGPLKGKRIAIWGLAFKPKTDDIREAPALTVLKTLLDEGATVVAYDPVAEENVKSHLRPSAKMIYVKNSYEACEKADALLVLTEWDEFRQPDFDRLKSSLIKPVIIDGRNIFDPATMADLGFNYSCIGKPKAAHSTNYVSTKIA